MFMRVLSAMVAVTTLLVAQDRIVTDESPVGPGRDDAYGREDILVPPAEGGDTETTVTLVLGLAFFIGLLIYALLRWQAQQSRR